MKLEILEQEIIKLDQKNIQLSIISSYVIDRFNNKYAAPPRVSVFFTGV